jgi:predicted house-cleaning noncanonical NTP pyrophosphatase (MazG superfamily)
VRTFKFNKLVRVRIPIHMRAQGEVPEVRTLSEFEYRQELANKLGEEALELSTTTGNEIIGELTDIYDILECLIEINGFTR